MGLQGSAALTADSRTHTGARCKQETQAETQPCRCPTLMVSSSVSPFWCDDVSLEMCTTCADQSARGVRVAPHYLTQEGGRSALAIVPALATHHKHAAPTSEEHCRTRR